MVAQSSGSGLTVDTGAAEAAAGAVGGGAPSPGVALRAQIQASTLAEKEKALGEAQQQVVAFRSKLEHARHEGTQQREKAARQKQLHEQSRAKWETERAKLQRQLQNVKTDVEKRTAWLDKVRESRASSPPLPSPPLSPPPPPPLFRRRALSRSTKSAPPSAPVSSPSRRWVAAERDRAGHLARAECN